MSKLRIVLYAMPLFALLIAGAIFFAARKPEAHEEIVISMPYNEYIRNIDTNYYKTWLEQKTGLSIKFNIIHEGLTGDYLRYMFSSGYVQSDAFFSLLGDTNLDDFNQLLEEFGKVGISRRWRERRRKNACFPYGEICKRQ